MIKKLIKNWASKIQKKETAKKTNQQLSDKDKERAEIYKQLRNLFQFVRWLEKYGFRNRRERKSFWKAVASNTHVVEDTVLTVSERYAKKDTEEYSMSPEKDIKEILKEKK